MGGECDFVKDVAIWYPLRVIMSIFGVPEEDEPLMLKLTQELFGSTDPDVNRSFEPAEFLNVVKDFEDYFAKLSEAVELNREMIWQPSSPTQKLTAHRFRIMKRTATT